MRHKPLHLRGSLPPRKRLEALFSLAFVALIFTVNYLVFFAGKGAEELSLDERLAKNVEIPAILDKPLEKPDKPQKTLRVEEGVVMRGETLTKTLLRLGVSMESTAAALRVLGEHVNLHALKPGQKVTAEVAEDGTLEKLIFPVEMTKHFEVIREESGYVCAAKEVETTKEVMSVACLIRGSLYTSLAQCGVDADLTSMFIDLLEGQVDFYVDVRRGDVIRFAVEREMLEDKFVRYGKVLGVLYEGRLVKASAFPAEVDGKIMYFDAEGRSVERPFRRSPLKYTRISSDYALRRLHPILYSYTPHRAIDYAAPRGTPVYAVGDGKVIFKGRKGAAGLMVVIQHEGGFQTYYAHLDKFANGLKVGDFVKKGTLIGTVGATGRATGPHLHFAVAKDGRFVHPRNLFASAGNPISPDAEPEFRARVARIISELKALSVRGVQGSKS